MKKLIQLRRFAIFQSFNGGFKVALSSLMKNTNIIVVPNHRSFKSVKYCVAVGSMCIFHETKYGNA